MEKPTSTPKDGGPAFPQSVSLPSTPDFYTSGTASVGMSLRDYFAAKALDGLLSKELFLRGAVLQDAHMSSSISKSAYEVADAMLAERNK